MNKPIYISRQVGSFLWISISMNFYYTAKGRTESRKLKAFKDRFRLMRDRYNEILKCMFLQYELYIVGKCFHFYSFCFDQFYSSNISFYLYPKLVYNLGLGSNQQSLGFYSLKVRRLKIICSLKIQLCNYLLLLNLAWEGERGLHTTTDKTA